MTTDSHRDCRVRGERSAATRRPQFIFHSDKRCWQQQLRQPDRNGDVSQQVLAGHDSAGLYSGSSLVRDPQMFPSRAQDVFGRPGSKGCTRSAAASDVVHSGRSHGSMSTLDHTRKLSCAEAISDTRKLNGCERQCSSSNRGPLQIDDHEGDVVGLSWP